MTSLYCSPRDIIKKFLLNSVNITIIIKFGKWKKCLIIERTAKDVCINGSGQSKEFLLGEKINEIKIKQKIKK